MSVLTRDQMFEEGALQTERVLLKKGEVIVSQIGAADYINLWSDPKNQKKDVDGKEVINMSRFTPALIAYSVVDESGNRIFTEADIERLAKFAQEPFLKLAEVARRLNGLFWLPNEMRAFVQLELPSIASA
jgi:hypothetical protein